MFLLGAYDQALGSRLQRMYSSQQCPGNKGKTGHGVIAERLSAVSVKTPESTREPGEMVEIIYDLPYQRQGSKRGH